jgi:hypothetical protein
MRSSAAAVERPEDVPGHIVTTNEIKPAVATFAFTWNPVNNAVRQNDQVSNLHFRSHFAQEI